MQNDINISLMQLSDIDEVVEIEKVSFSTPWTKEGFCESLKKDYCCYIVARTNDNVLAGYCGFYQSDIEADITNVAVSLDYRNKGVAYKMLKYLIEIGEKRGVQDFTLEVRAGNEIAIKLYKKLGFESVGFRKNFYANPTEDACIMWRYH